jgi:hypothetical protein
MITTEWIVDEREKVAGGKEDNESRPKGREGHD